MRSVAVGGVGEDRQARGHLLMSGAPRWCGWAAAWTSACSALLGRSWCLEKGSVVF